MPGVIVAPFLNRHEESRVYVGWETMAHKLDRLYVDVKG